MIQIYTDGSYSSSIARAGWGYVAIDDGIEMNREWGSIVGGPYIKHRNIAGEVIAVEEGIKWATLNGYKEIEIFCDYEGLIHWASGAWKAKNDLTKGYVKFLKDRKKEVRIKWTKVKAHSGNKWNEVADELAGLGSSE